MADIQELQPEQPKKPKNMDSIWNDDLPWADGFATTDIEADTEAEVIVLPRFPEAEVTPERYRDWA